MLTGAKLLVEECFWCFLKIAEKPFLEVSLGKPHDADRTEEIILVIDSLGKSFERKKITQKSVLKLSARQKTRRSEVSLTMRTLYEGLLFQKRCYSKKPRKQLTEVLKPVATGYRLPRSVNGYALII